MSGNTAVKGNQDTVILSQERVDSIDKSAGLGVDFKGIRQAALAVVNAEKLPTAHDELWRYTRPELFGFHRFQTAEKEEIKLEPFDGNSDISKIEFKTGEAAAISAKDILNEYILGEKGADLKEDAVAALHLATLSNLAFISVPKNYRSETPVKLSQIFSGKSCHSSLIVVSVAAGASLTIVEDLAGTAAGLVAPRLEVVIGDRAELTYCCVQRFESDVSYLARHRFYTGRDSKLNSVHLALGAASARTDLDLRMFSPGADARMLGLYLVKGTQHIDFHPTQYHLAPHCRSDFFSKGVLRDAGRSVYYGYIRVAEGAQKTDAYQTNRNLILSTQARADSIPNLAIKANDVRCSHGASVSHVNKEDLFYLMTRGLPKDQAEELLVQGFLEDLLGRVPEESLRTWLSNLVLQYS